MNVLSRLVEAIGLKSTFTRVSAGTHPQQPEMISLPQGKWTDDSSLRLLAEEGRGGNSQWSIAADMAEFFDHLDAYNERRDPLLQIRLLVSRRFDEFFDMVTGLGWHSTPGNRGPEEVSKGDLLIEQAGRVTRAYYNAADNAVKMETVDGWSSINFEAGDPLRDALSTRMATCQRHSFSYANLECNG